ncbi:MAG: DUF3326 domain-containing protein [Candidatus Poribacteria bacterium]|nr:DUF3326 domain-containing protein [Candidatus Poribacteria bacterium]
MEISEKSITIPALIDTNNFIEHFRTSVGFQLKSNEIPIRFAITESNKSFYKCEVGVVTGTSFNWHEKPMDLFAFRPRKLETSESFTAVLLIPTGIGSEIGGHAGDATAVAHLLAESCDRLILHPNVVNASDINELPNNALYVEGSIVTRLLMGMIGLQPTRSNRVLVILDDHMDKHFVNGAINSVNAARATYGLNCSNVVCLNPSFRMFADYSESGCAVGRVEEVKYCLEVLRKFEGDYDAIALSSVIRVPQEYHLDYFRMEGKMVNPWGGVEAMLTHTISSLLNVPTAHSPMFESKKIENIETGVVDPRMAAEAVSLAFLQCILKGLHRSPKIIQDELLFARPDVISAEDISCLIVPEGCLGLPTIAALAHGIYVISVRENRNLMRNDLSQLPWHKGKLIQVDNYLEAAGVINALKSGVTLESVRRPIYATKVTTNINETVIDNTNVESS